MIGFERISDMTPFAIALPDSITEAEAKFYLALKLYEVGRLSSGEAAELAGYSKRTFLEFTWKKRGFRVRLSSG